MSGKTTKKREFERVERLRRRADFIRQRVPKLGTANSATYDAGELSALEWAIPILENHIMHKTIESLPPETRTAFGFKINN